MFIAKKNRKKKISRAALLLSACLLATAFILMGFWAASSAPASGARPALAEGSFFDDPDEDEYPDVDWVQEAEIFDPAPTATARPSVADMFDAADQATDAEIAAAQAAAEPFEYLPIYSKASVTDKRIAITVDDCYQLENMKRIIAAAYAVGGRLTFFPVGEAVAKDGMAKVLRDCVGQLGYEIENHTWSHSRVFRLPESEMAAEIWKQKAAVSKALGVNYHQHFFRLMGGDGMRDQRTHNYLKQLGYSGIAYWTISGSNAEMDMIQSYLSPGTVYLFHTTDRDTRVLEEFIPYAASQGYKLVTLNELFGLPANEMTELSTMETEMPQPQPYVVEYHDEKEGNYSWAVVRIQTRLHELGYLGDGAKSALEGNVADGVYGESTAAAVAAFQRDAGLEATGVADVETQRRLLDGN